MRNKGACLILFLAGVFSLVTVGRIVFSFHLNDFEVYYQAVKLFLNGANPYINLVRGEKYIYPPGSLILLSPLGLLPYRVAEVGWTIVSWFLTIGTIGLLIKISKTKAVWLVGGITYAVMMNSFPTKFSLGMGQINLVMLGLICTTLYCYLRGRSFWAGLLLGLAITIKLNPILLILFFIKKRDKRVVITSLMVVMILNLLAWWRLGGEVVNFYWSTTFWGIPTVGNGVYYNQALTGMLARLAIPDSLAFGLNLGVAYLLLKVSLNLIKSAKETGWVALSEYALLINTLLIISGLAWQHHFVLMLIVFYSLYCSITVIKERGKLTWALGLMVAFVLVAGNLTEVGSGTGIIVGLKESHVLIGSVLSFGLLAWRLKENQRIKMGAER